MGLPGEEEQHEQVNSQSPPAAARPQEVGSEGVATATVVEAPAEIRSEGHVEEEELAERKGVQSMRTEHAFINEAVPTGYIIASSFREGML